MKTQKRGLAGFLKKVAITSFMAMALASCGGNNTSGGANGINGQFGQFGNIGVQGGLGNLSAVLNQVSQLMPCQYGGARVQITAQIVNPIGGNLYKPVMGITVEGDIAVQTNPQTVDLFLCQRPDQYVGQAQALMKALPIPETYCPVDGLAMDASVQTQMYGYQFAFFPVTQHGQIAQSICR